MNDASDIETRIRDDVLSNFVSMNPSEIPNNASLVELGVIDSMGVMEFVALLESNFNIEIRDNETLPQNIDTIDNLTAFVLRKLNSRSG